jgi:hypothetical protein
MINNLINILLCCYTDYNYEIINNSFYDNEMDDTDDIITNLFYDNDYEKLSEIKISLVYNYVINKITFKKFIDFGLDTTFIINYWNLNNNLAGNEFNYVGEIITKLITFNIFNQLEIEPELLPLIKKHNLFNLKLFMELLLNPDYNYDEDQIKLVIFLVKNDIINLYTNLIFYDLNYNIIELILLGKVRIDNNKVVFVRHFHNKESIEQLLKLSKTNFLI